MMPDAQTIRAAANEAASQLLGRPLKPGQRLVSSGLIDSLSVLKLIGLLEKKLRIVIPPETLQPEDFDDLDLIVETIERVASPIT
ncbi:MAG TPA: phosphopantetheine-binding protein [Candidatus Eisenbacteria bacterium]|nr:phosphopantetheine-binding protein [Candidatus Eisenbacteria bacterium]